jgi:hypothetical protein
MYAFVDVAGGMGRTTWDFPHPLVIAADISESKAQVSASLSIAKPVPVFEQMYSVGPPTAETVDEVGQEV